MEGERYQKYGYQVPDSERIRKEAGIMTMAVGHIVHADQAEEILQQGRADLVALAREVMYNPNWPMDAARKLGVEENLTLVPDQQAYWLGRRDATAPEVVPSTFGRDIQV